MQGNAEIPCKRKQETKLQATSSSSAPLPVVPIIKGALSFAWQERESLVLRLLPAALVLAAIDTADTWFARIGTSGLTLIHWMLELVDIPIWTIFAVTVHRTVLQEESSRRGLWPYTWSGRETRVLGWFLAACLLGGGISLAVGIWFGIAGSLNLLPPFDERAQALIPVFLALVPIAYVLTPLSLLFPATAVGQRRGLDWAYQVSRGSVWRLLVIQLAPAAPAIPILLVASATAEESTFVGFFIDLFREAMSVIPLIALTLSFKYLALRTPSPGGTN